MPYNLRKRKEPPVVEKPVVVRKKKATPSATPVPNAGEDQPVDEKPVVAKKRRTTPAAAKVVEEKKVEEGETIPDIKEAPVPEVKPVTEKAPVIKKQKAAPVAPVSQEVKTTCNQLVFGNDSCGELGFGKIGITKKRPIPVPVKARMKQVACGPMHTLSLTEDGVVYSYGCNDEGALGRVTDGDDTLESTPTIVELKGNVTKISSGDSHGAALTENNEVYVWGNFRDEHGSVGLLPECDGEATYKPIRVLPDKKFKDIASGSNHMLLLDVDGVIYSFGVGAQGQLGRLSVEQVGDKENTVAITAANRSMFLAPQPVNMKNVDPSREFICDAIYAGNFSSFATNTDKKKNRLAGWGLNNRYQLGYKGQKGQHIQYHPRRSTFTCSTSMINVACGQHHTLFLTKTGRVYSAGRNEYGMLGIGNNMKDKTEVCPAKQIEAFATPVTDISAGINTSFAVNAEGKLYAWGMNGSNLGVDLDDNVDLMVPTEVENLAAHKVISVSSGSSFTAVIVE